MKKGGDKIKTAKFSPGIYHIFIEPAPEGETDGPERNSATWRAVHIYTPDQTSRSFLETAVHESMHAEWPEMTEAKVTASARNIARLLWRLGFRRQKQK